MKKVIKPIKKIISSLLSLVLVALVALVGFLTYCNITDTVAYVGNYAFVQIISPSMEPKIPVGEYILIEKYEQQKIEVGDVIVFRSSDESIKGKLNTHRVVKIEEKNGEKTYITKGDNNAIEDKIPVNEKDISALYVKNIPSFSKVADFFNQKQSFFILILIPALILIFICVKDVYQKAHELKIESKISEEVERLKKEEKEKAERDEKDV